MRINSALVFLLVLLISCGEDPETIRLREANARLSDSLARLRTAPVLLSDGEKFLAAKDFGNARQKFQQLVDDFGDQPESAQAKLRLITLDDEQGWYAATSGSDTTNTVAYLTAFPRGKHIREANDLLAKQRIAAESDAYNGAVSSNTSTAWRSFLNSYPNHGDADAIRERIIRLEVSEIMAGEHGDMPVSRAISTSYDATTSSVTIYNRTGYPLTVRYSGSVARSIEISNGTTREINLPSGNYQVAASANGLYYGGSETLSGDYSSEFYIRTTSSSSYYRY